MSLARFATFLLWAWSSARQSALVLSSLSLAQARMQGKVFELILGFRISFLFPLVERLCTRRVTTLALLSSGMRLVATIVSKTRAFAVVAAIQFARRYATLTNRVATFGQTRLGYRLLYHDLCPLLVEDASHRHSQPSVKDSVGLPVNAVKAINLLVVFHVVRRHVAVFVLWSVREPIFI